MFIIYAILIYAAVGLGVTRLFGRSGNLLPKGMYALPVFMWLAWPVTLIWIGSVYFFNVTKKATKTNSFNEILLGKGNERYES